MPIQFTPDVARLAPATRLTRRGESPTVMVEQDHDLLKQCPWLDTTAGVNPGGTEVGISEEIVEFMLLNFAKLVEPMAILFGSFRIDADAAMLLHNGELWTDDAGERRPVGSCEASPMPLAGSN